MISSLVAREPEPVEAMQVVDARLLPAALCCWGVTIAVLICGWPVGIAVALGLLGTAAGLAAMVQRERLPQRPVAALALLLGAGVAMAVGLSGTGPGAGVAVVMALAVAMACGSIPAVRTQRLVRRAVAWTLVAAVVIGGGVAVVVGVGSGVVAVGVVATVALGSVSARCTKPFVRRAAGVVSATAPVVSAARGNGDVSEGRRAVAWTLLAAVLLGAGFAMAAAWREHRVATHPIREAYGLSTRVVATPTDDPKPMRASGFGGEPRWIVRAALREYRGADAAVRSGGRVVILASGPEWGELLPGQPIEFRAQPQPPKHHDLTVAALHAMGPPKPVAAPPWWQRAAASVRGDFSAAATAALSSDAAGLLPALVLGDTSGLPEPVRKDFETAGLQHLCVVSGANFTILLSVVLFVVRSLSVGPRVAATAAAAALLMFVVVARPDPSVLRAAAMGAVTLLALVTGRRKQALPALCAAVIGLLLVWPELAVNAGFALSVLATAGLILLAPGWADWLRARGWWRLPAEVVAVSAAAFTVTVPIMVALTGRVSVVAILANVLVAPVIAPITVVGALGAACASVWSPLAEPVLRCAGPPLWWLLEVAERTAELPGATITVPAGSTGGLTAAALVIVAVCALRSAPVRRLATVVVLAVAAVLLPARLWHPGWPPSDWVLAACDIGQGDGLALATGPGTAVVIDVGPDPRTMRACLDRLRIRHIALLALTHPHADHIGGLTGALHGRAVAAIATAPGELADATSLSDSTAPEQLGEAMPSRLPAVPGELGEVMPSGLRAALGGVDEVMRSGPHAVLGGVGEAVPTELSAVPSEIGCTGTGEVGSTGECVPGMVRPKSTANAAYSTARTAGVPATGVVTRGGAVGAVPSGPCAASGERDGPMLSGRCAASGGAGEAIRAGGSTAPVGGGDAMSLGRPISEIVSPARRRATDERAPLAGAAQVAEIAARKGIPLIELAVGHVLRFGAVELTVLAPAAPGPGGPHLADEPNDRSLVIAAATPAGRILLTGDIESAAQSRLLRDPASLRADILKVPHHGSRTTTSEFLAAVRPRLAVISSGADNTFGHPHPKILTELHSLGTMIARTDQYGDVLIAGGPSDLRVVTTRSGPNT
ncbi:ComEC/Rec2 family competence protein [Nocardia xishanensis]